MLTGMTEDDWWIVLMVDRAEDFDATQSHRESLGVTVALLVAAWHDLPRGRVTAMPASVGYTGPAGVKATPSTRQIFRQPYAITHTVISVGAPAGSDPASIEAPTAPGSGNASR